MQVHPIYPTTITTPDSKVYSEQTLNIHRHYSQVAHTETRTKLKILQPQKQITNIYIYKLDICTDVQKE